MNMTTERRFIRKVNVGEDDECWPYTGGLTPLGYGQFKLNGKQASAHIIAYFLRHKKLPLHDKDGNELHVCHKCDNPKCCNPSHLFLGTREDNFIDSVKKGRKGASNPKLYAGEVWLIRKLKIPIKGYSRKKYKFTTRYVAKMFKTCHFVILKIWNSDKYLCKEGYYM